ncbi:MAG TPA: tetratricopeptide repeat protein, partial [Nitrospira sp.]
GMPTLHEEIFDKIKTLVPDSPIVHRLTTLIQGGSPTGETLTPLATEAALGSDSALPPPASSAPSRATEDFSLAGAAPDDAWSLTSKIVRGQDRHFDATESIPTSDETPAAATFSTANACPDNPPSRTIHPFSAAAPQIENTEVAAPPHVASPVQAPGSDSSEPPTDGLDLETHYTLGVAYKNMGLLEEAKEEFLISMKSPAVFLDSCLMMAVCLKEQGQIDAASAQLERLLSDSRCQGAKAQAIRYELGLLYETQAQWREAMTMFESIPTFHDVPERLSSIRTRCHSGPVSPEAFRYAS